MVSSGGELTQNQVLNFIFPDARQSQLFYLHPQEWGIKSQAKKQRETCIKGVASTGCHTKRNPRMVCSWEHTELPWPCCKMDAPFHNPPSTILLNLSHITFLASLKGQTFAEDLKCNSATFSSHIPSLVVPPKSRDSSSNEPEEPLHSGGSSKKKSTFFPGGDPLQGEGRRERWWQPSCRGDDKMSDSWQYKMAAEPWQNAKPFKQRIEE